MSDSTCHEDEGWDPQMQHGQECQPIYRTVGGPQKVQKCAPGPAKRTTIKHNPQYPVAELFVRHMYLVENQEGLIYWALLKNL